MHTILSLMMVLGDCQGDGWTDLQDFQHVRACITGPGLLLDDAPCECADIDRDGDSDLFDLALFQLRFGKEYPCGGAAGSCMASHDGPGCGEGACCEAVCGVAPSCCYGTWDSACVHQAVETCGVSPTPANDDCGNPLAVTDGTTAFSNVGAATDGPVEDAARCDYLEVTADVWFTYTATCTGFAIVSLCGSDYDTTLAVYNLPVCPTRPRAIQCSDDDCWELESRAIAAVVEGQTYLVRVGGYDGETGDGILSIRCTVDGSNGDVCGRGTDDCDLPHRNPGCADAEYCEEICEEDPFCCDVTWNDRCSGTALLCCVYGTRGDLHPPRFRCTEGGSCPRSNPVYHLVDSFEVESCDECP